MQVLMTELGLGAGSCTTGPFRQFLHPFQKIYYTFMALHVLCMCTLVQVPAETRGTYWTP